MDETPSYKSLECIDFGANNWCLAFQPLYKHALLTSLSNGEVHHLDWDTGKSKQVTETGDISCNDLKVINSDYNNGTLYAVASGSSVKIFDIRSQNAVALLKNDKNAPFLSLDSRHNFLASGTELSGVDAEILMHDIRKWNVPVKTFIDSHHDDVTDLKFHPSDPHILLSGSTDGYTNIYDLRHQDEEDCLHQVINFASIHSCGWLSPKRIYTLSHMETFAIHELNDITDEAREPKPLDFCDVRETWNCGYVIDIYPGFIAAGSSQQNCGFLKLLPFENEIVEVKNSIVIPSAHGDEVIRDVYIPPEQSDLLYSCGEDGCVRIWKGRKALNVPSEFWEYSAKLDVLSDSTPVPVQPNTLDAEATKRPIEVIHSDSRKEKNKKNSKKSQSKRYKPY